MQDAVIVGAVRTAIGSFNGSLAPLGAVELGARVLENVLQRHSLPGCAVDEVIMGNVLQAGQGQNPARQAALRAGLPVAVPALTVNKVCGSGLAAVNLAAQAIRSGDSATVIAGGMESMSNAPYLLGRSARWGYRMGHEKIIDAMLQDGLWCAEHDFHMGMTAELVAQDYGLTRDELDRFAALSQAKAKQAQERQEFQTEILPVAIRTKQGEQLVAVDEFVRPAATAEALAKLRPAFTEQGVVTAGNASGINDGAAALLLMAEGEARRRGLTARARIVSYAAAGVEPSRMGLGPVPAVRGALAKARLTMADIDLIEANEAFAAQALAVARELELPDDKLNVNGGAIALGHPIGASGARILVTLLHALEARGKRRGLATLCIGGGQGIATIIERI